MAGVFAIAIAGVTCKTKEAACAEMALMHTGIPSTPPLPALLLTTPLLLVSLFIFRLACGTVACGTMLVHMVGVEFTSVQVTTTVPPRVQYLL
jgi:hypothetical protein